MGERYQQSGERVAADENTRFCPVSRRFDATFGEFSFSFSPEGWFHRFRALRALP
jgi:hypothetical protein